MEVSNAECLPQGIRYSQRATISTPFCVFTVLTSGLIEGLLQAAERLSISSNIAGRKYFITNNEPYSFWGFMGDILEPLGYERPRVHLPWLPLYIAALFLECVLIPFLRFFRVQLKPSEFNSQRIKIATCNRVISCRKAMQDLGYSPKISIKEGVERTVAHFRPLLEAQNNKKHF